VRIIAGFLKGRRLNIPKNINIRPTTDFAKESLFNIINNKVSSYQNLEVLDLFSGTGSISYEFISRGAKQVFAIEKNFKCISFIKNQIEVLNIKNLKAIKMSAPDFLDICHMQFDIIFADPPYDMKNIEKIAEVVRFNRLLKPEGFLIIEHSKQNNFSELEGFTESRKYGSVNFSFFRY